MSPAGQSLETILRASPLSRSALARRAGVRRAFTASTVDGARVPHKAMARMVEALSVKEVPASGYAALVAKIAGLAEQARRSGARVELHVFSPQAAHGGVLVTRTTADGMPPRRIEVWRYRSGGMWCAWSDCDWRGVWIPRFRKRRFGTAVWEGFLAASPQEERMGTDWSAIGLRNL